MDKCEILKVFRSEKVDEYNRIDLMAVKWELARVPVLEKRRIWILKDGTVRYRKLVGFTAEDIEFINNNRDEILKIIGGTQHDEQVADDLSAVHSPVEVRKMD